MKHVSKLSTLQARTLLAHVNAITLTDINGLNDIALNIVNVNIATYPTVFCVTDKLVYLAFTLSQVYQKALNNKLLSVVEYMQLLAQHKKYLFEHFNDLGAFCDLYEILIRIAFIKNLNFLKPYHLAVKPILSTDLVSKKYGKIEIGFNGKTLQEGTLFDYMAGNYSALCYGVIDNYTRDIIVNACINGDLSLAIKTIKAYTILTDKNDFIPILSTYRRGKIVVVKSGKIMIQYNDSLYSCVLSAIDNGDFITLSDIL